MQRCIEEITRSHSGYMPSNVDNDSFHPAPSNNNVSYLNSILDATGESEARLNDFTPAASVAR